MARLLYERMKPSILFKVDLTKAFNSVAWPFLLEVLQHFDFSVRWQNWMSAILSTTSTRVLINGMPGARICHGCGLRQGGPLLPMLFILALEILGALIRKADQWGLFQHFRTNAIPHMASFYANDLILFMSPEE
jgi:hypothetical protein